jgi:hypothetical protein
MVLAATVLCQPLVEHLGMEFTESQLSILLGGHRKYNLLLLIAEETDHSNPSTALDAVLSR